DLDPLLGEIPVLDRQVVPRPRQDAQLPSRTRATCARLATLATEPASDGTAIGPPDRRGLAAAPTALAGLAISTHSAAASNLRCESNHRTVEECTASPPRSVSVTPDRRVAQGNHPRGMIPLSNSIIFPPAPAPAPPAS